MPAKLRQFTIRALLILTTLAAIAASAVRSDSFFDKQVVMYQRTAHAFDAGGGYVISETFRVTDKGGETFAKTPRDLFQI